MAISAYVKADDESHKMFMILLTYDQSLMMAYYLPHDVRLFESEVYLLGPP